MCGPPGAPEEEENKLQWLCLNYSALSDFSKGSPAVLDLTLVGWVLAGVSGREAAGTDGVNHPHMV